MAVALSTAWNSFRSSDGYSMLFEIKELGFDEVELGFNISASMLSGIKKAVHEGLIKVSSIHNTCPTPDELPRETALPDYYPMSSPDEEKRAAAVKYAKRSIDTACELGAKALVLHCGRLEVPDRTRRLIELFNRGQKLSEEFSSIREEMQQERRQSVHPYLANTLRSLEKIASYAQSKNVLLGVENRFYFREIPSFDEVGLILDAFKGSGLLYWHDTGHAQIMSVLGLGPSPQECVARYKDLLLGTHIHDVEGCQDHLAPGKGKFDFSYLRKHFDKNTLKVIEAHHPASARDVKSSKDFLTSLFDDSR